MGTSQAQQTFLRHAFGDSVAITESSSVGGGCIHTATKITLADGRQFFLKQNRAEFAAMFETEFFGLQQLARSGAVHVPCPIQFGTADDSAFLLMEWIEPNRPDTISSKRLGESLAQLHQSHAETRFGFEIDNFIGSTPQKNTWSNSWPEFFLSCRLEPQVAMARDRGFSFGSLVAESFWQRAERKLQIDCPPSLLHGDLWGGNYLIGPGGDPYLIDPAPYWGHYEAEFGILTLFGGFDSDFFEAYRASIPVEEGYEERLVLYQLYHYLNHLNLFGGSYLGQCERLLARV